ncbi:MAG: ATP-binding protein [Acutalibacteraceae bacterium]|jgi:predicted AAA+ superfamily ATPase
MNGALLDRLTVFHRLADDPVLAALRAFYAAPSAAAYTAVAAALYDTGTACLSDHIRDLVDTDDNAYIRLLAKGDTPSSTMRRAVDADLAVLQMVADLTPAELQAAFDADGFLPEWDNLPLDLLQRYHSRAAAVGRYGYGDYAKYPMFTLSDEGRILPVQYPDPVRLSDLAGYAREKAIILTNTRALLEGKPAANMLLTGDAGTGKSSTVKAVVNELRDEGLRILEIRKEQLHLIPAVMDELAVNPLKFIVFIDDLSFARDDDNFGALKAILEGSVAAKSNNVVIYATSNRRHLVRETFSERDGDDVHLNDTLQEIVSLSERFGIRVTFQRPDKAAYLAIVRELVEARGIAYDPHKLEIAAERFALTRGTRSPRAAKHFADSLLTGSAEEIQ